MKKLRIGVDVDGILGDFNVSYGQLIKREFPHISVPDINEHFPNTWGWDKALGLLTKDVTRLWETIEEDEEFWLNISVYADAPPFLEYLSWLPTEHDVYFITSRPGLTSKIQTEVWLEKYGYEEPTVLISSEKGMCAKALKLTHYLDDRNENCIDTYELSPKTSVYMLARAWNQEQTDIPRLATLADFQQVIEEARA